MCTKNTHPNTLNMTRKHTDMFYVGSTSAHSLSHTQSLFPNSLTPPLHTHYFSSLEKLNGVKLSVGPSVSWVFGRDEKDSEQWEGHWGRKIGRRKGTGGIGVRSINMNQKQNPTADPSVVVLRPETFLSQDNRTLIGE